MAKGYFKVDKAFFLPPRDLFVLTGEVVHGKIEAGQFIDLPKSVRGPGRVPIHSIEPVQFRHGVMSLGVTIRWDHLTSAPWLEFQHVEGRILEVTG